MSAEHFIGGERIASERTFTDSSPIDEQPLGEIARGGQREADLAVAAATEAFPAWAALGAAGRAVYLHRLADLIDANVDRLAAVECLDMAMLLRSLKARLINRGARNYRSYADLAVAYVERVWDSNGTREPGDPDAERPRRRDHSVERPVHALHVEDGACTRGRLDRDPQARRMVAALLLAARRPRRRGRASRPASSTSCRGSARRSAPRSSPTRASGASPSPVRRRRHGTSASPRRRTSSPSRVSSAARAPCSSSPTAISRPPRGRPPGSSTTPARCASRAPGSSCRSRWRSRFSSCSTGSPTNTSSATPVTTTRPSRR